jgi:Tfp pilus assembly protein PilX
MNLPRPFDRMSWGQIFKETAKSTLGVVAIVVIVISFAIIMGGCSTAEKVVQHSEAAEDAFEQADDFLRSKERAINQAHETIQSAKRLKPQRTCIEAKDASTEYDARARLIGSDERHVLRPTEFVRWHLSGGWATDSHEFTIEMEVFRDGEYVRTTAQRIENEFNKYEISKEGCGVLYFTSDKERIEGLQKPREMDF